MKITLIYPGISNIGFDSFGKGWLDTTWINLGLAYIGAYLEKNDYEVDLLDLRTLRDWEEVCRETKKRGSDIYGVYFDTVNFSNALECSKIIKNTGKLVVGGGPHATIAPQDLIKSGIVDYVIVGEGEISFLELVKDIELNKSRESIIIGKHIEKLDNLPFPKRDLYDLSGGLQPKRAFPFMDQGTIVMTSRGCPYKCTFCQPTLKKIFGKKIRQRSVDNVLEEIEDVINKYKVKHISIHDEIFTLNKKWALDFCKKMEAKKFDIQWSAQSRVDTFDEELAEAMSSAGCMCLFFGFESGSQRILDLLKKGITPEQSIRAAKICKKYGMIIWANFILGIPTETEEDLKQTYLLSKRIKPEMPAPNIFTPIPGTELYQYCKDRGKIMVKSYEDYGRWLTTKIKDVDYVTVKKYQELIAQTSSPWYSEKYFARVVFRRWRYLLSLGLKRCVIFEIYLRTPLLHYIVLMVKKTKWGRRLISYFRKKMP